MSSAQSPKAAPARRTRKSIAHLPSPDLGLDKENTEHGTSSTTGTAKAAAKKGRSKSLGPGGLDALKEDAGNRQKVAPLPKSILKPTIPLSPPKQIPPRSTSRKSSPTKTHNGLSPRKSPQKDGLGGAAQNSSSLRQSGLENLPNPFDEPAGGIPTEKDLSEGTRIAVRTEEEQQAAAREREKQDILERRDARRKSLANRRVSFAPEATLHTWDLIESVEDATTSSEATNSTRRASSGSTLTASPFPQGFETGVIDAPSTPPTQIEEIQVAASPADQRNAHQKKRRRSSGIPPMNFNNPDDYSSSPEGSIVSDDTENQTFTTADGNVDSSDSDDNDLVVREDTISGIDEDNTTNHSIASVQSAGGSSTSSSGRLEKSLRQAAVQAGTQGIEHDEYGDLTMEMADDEVTNAFAPLVQQRAQAGSARNLVVPEDKENVNPFSPAFKANIQNLGGRVDDEEQDQTMDFTQAAGAILAAPPPQNPSPKRGRPKGAAPKRRRSSGGRRRSSGGSSVMADETMDLTTAIGGIQQIQPLQAPDENSFMDENEDLTMEFTAAVGGLLDKNRASENGDDLASQQLLFEQNRRGSINSTFNDDTMDMTMAMGEILTSITERTEPSEDETSEMDFTRAIGAILPSDLKTNDKNVAKRLMEEEAEHGQLTKSPFGRTASQEASASQENHGRPSIATSETGSPSLITASARNTRRSAGPRPSTTPNATSRQSTPLKKPVTPSKQLTPQPQRPTTPAGKTPPSKNVAMRLSSPKRLFKAEIKKAATTTPKSQVPKLKFHENTTTGTATPSIVFTPVQRLASGLGLEKDGLGSPRVAALLDRRVSIGDAAESFNPTGRTTSTKTPVATGVRFEDPRVMLEELEHERAETERRESGRGILQMEADLEEERDATANLRDMIESLTPKKNKLKGRKSLHVGAARGLLGKRPAELDEDDEEDPSPKRVAGKNRSPVKGIKLPAPPSKDETTGRLSKGPGFSLVATSGNQLQTPTTDSFSPAKAGATTPKNQGRYKDTKLVLSAAKPPVTFNDKLTGVATPETEPAEEEERIHLQDFLNLTSIRFMELTTTKRRHTVAPNNGFGDSLRRSASQGEDERGLESCVVAGACTVPMLELYQHSCRELKKYISEGRSIVHEIEVDTFEENPPLFREYLSASPEIKAIMDTQFKNVKTHARLLSKAMWYEWRMKLLDGLKDGLLRISRDLDEDSGILSQQEQLLQTVLPQLVEQHDQLAAEAKLLQAKADELANCDQEELEDAREQLVHIDSELEEKRQMVAELQEQLREREQAIEDAAERKLECQAEIKEAERVREECRGWSGSEVAALKANVDALQGRTGWTITSASGPSITFTYKSTLQLFLTPASYLSSTAASERTPISLTYIADLDPYHPIPLSTSARFFLQNMRVRLQCLVQSETSVKDALGFVSQSWELARGVQEEIGALERVWVTTPEIKSDDVLAVRTSVLLRDMRTKVEVTYQVRVNGEALQMGTEVDAEARVVYGEDLNEGKMGLFLMQNVGKEGGSWAGAVRELEGRLIARGTREKKGE
ncbi:hypothetical protein MMC30_008367 [Trapelia coarctata]|nr:hypothetical protein [Trapelia coarctata]